MSTATRTICDQCQGVIPAGAPCVKGVSAQLVTGTGTETFDSLDFCCTEHMSTYIAAQPQIATPQTAYTPIPS